MIYGGNNGTFARCKDCGADYPWPGAHTCPTNERGDVIPDRVVKRLMRPNVTPPSVIIGVPESVMPKQVEAKCRECSWSNVADSSALAERLLEEHCLALHWSSERWCPTCGKYHVADDRHEDEAVAGIPAAPFAEAISHLTDGPPNKERALAAICRILDRLDRDDRHRVVDALVALGAG